jgi:hypothetical protein
MADQKQPQQGPPTKVRTYELENRTRNVYRFPRSRYVKRANGQQQLVHDHKLDLVLGDAADRALPRGIERGPRCPDPVVRITSEQLDEIGERNRRVLDRLIADGAVSMREIAA